MRRKRGGNMELNSTNSKLYLIIILIISVVLPASSFAEGKFTLKPKLSASWKVDDNLYKAEAAEREVTTTLIQPGVEIGFQTPKSMITFDYTLDSYDYSDEDPVPAGAMSADSEDYTGHTAVFDLKAAPTKKVKLGLSNSYMKTRDPANSDAFNNSIARDKYSINRLTPQVFYDFGGKFTAGLQFRRTETDYDIGTREDSTESRPIFDMIYNFNKTTSVDLEYQYWDMDYDLGTSDYDSIQAKLIFRKQYKYFAVEAGAGYQSRDFDDPTLAGIDMFTYRFGIMGQNPPAPEAMPKSRLSLILESNLNDAGTGDAYYTATRFTFNAGHTFMEKFPVELTGKLQNSDYERTAGLTPVGTTELRDDDLFTIEGSVGYLFNEWLNFKVTTGHENRESNLAGKDYDNNYMKFLLKFSYSFDKR